MEGNDNELAMNKTPKYFSETRRTKFKKPMALNIQDSAYNMG